MKKRIVISCVMIAVVAVTALLIVPNFISPRPAVYSDSELQEAFVFLSGFIPDNLDNPAVYNADMVYPCPDRNRVVVGLAQYSQERIDSFVGALPASWSTHNLSRIAFEQSRGRPVADVPLVVMEPPAQANAEMDFDAFVELLGASGFEFELENYYVWNSAAGVDMPTGHKAIYIGDERIIALNAAISQLDLTVPTVQITWEPSFMWPTKDLLTVVYSGFDIRIIDFLNEIFGDNLARYIPPTANQQPHDAPAAQPTFSAVANPDGYHVSVQYITVEITNTSQVSGEFGRGYRIERYVSGRWERVPIDVVITDDMLYLPAGQTFTANLVIQQNTWQPPRTMEDYHVEHTPGRYRVVLVGVPGEPYAEFVLAVRCAL